MNPEEVIKTMAADWRRRSMSYYDVAKITGYKYQTIANFMSSKNTFFTSAQALKFQPLGYNLDFLMFGKGSLYPEDDIASSVENGNNIMPDGYKLIFLLNCVKTLGDIYDDPLIQLVYLKFQKAMTTKDRHECAETLAAIQQLLGLAMVQHGITYDENGNLRYANSQKVKDIEDTPGEYEDDE